MPHDPTESIRREMLSTGQPARDYALCNDRMWDTDQLRLEFEVLAFLAPFVLVRRLRDNRKGCMEFTHSPRMYFNWQPDDQVQR